MQTRYPMSTQTNTSSSLRTLRCCSKCQVKLCTSLSLSLSPFHQTDPLEIYLGSNQSSSLIIIIIIIIVHLGPLAAPISATHSATDEQDRSATFAQHASNESSSYISFTFELQLSRYIATLAAHLAYVHRSSSAPSRHLRAENVRDRLLVRSFSMGVSRNLSQFVATLYGHFCILLKPEGSQEIRRLV